MSRARHRWPSVLSLLAVSAWMSPVLSVGCGGSGPVDESPEPVVALEPTRGYILISIDTLRADHLGAYGYSLPTSPSFDALASRGSLFERLVVQYPATLTSHMSMFTGLYPQEHRVLPPSAILSEAISTLPEHFQRQGFRTAGHTEGGFVAGGYGFDRGFDEFTDTAYRADTDIERTFERGLEFLRSLDEDVPFFLFLHTYSVHDPYAPPERYKKMFWQGPSPAAFDSSGENLRRVNAGTLAVEPETVDYFQAMYDASIRYADDVLGDLVQELESMGLMDQTTLIVTSDHGEEFAEHGRMAHTQVYPETLVVPLLVVHPQQTQARRISQVVESVDLAPTLLALAGLQGSSEMSGRSLVGLLEGTITGQASSQGYAEVFDVEFVRTVLAEDRGRRYQLVMTEPEWDPVGLWIRDRVTFDTEESSVRFEWQSFHETRTIAVELEGERVSEFTVGPGWTPIELALPTGPRAQRVTLIADGCVVPAAVSDSEDGRCLAFQIRGFIPRRLELYDLIEDPEAQNDLFLERPELRRRLAERILSRKWTPRGEAAEKVLSQEDEETLRALGYLD